MCIYSLLLIRTLFFFFNDTATPEIYTLSLHDALPISLGEADEVRDATVASDVRGRHALWAYRESHTESINAAGDRKSTRLNSSHSSISYAVFCLKKKKTKKE